MSDTTAITDRIHPAQIPDVRNSIRDQVVKITRCESLPTSAKNSLVNLSEIHHSFYNSALRNDLFFAKSLAQNHIAKTTKVNRVSSEVLRTSFAASAAREHLAKISGINRFACDISLKREPFLSTISAPHRAYNAAAEVSRLARDEALDRVSRQI